MKLFKSLKSALAAKDEVTHLKLSLRGNLPSEIFELPNLRELYLDGDCPKLPDMSPLKHLELLSLTLTKFEEGLTEILTHSQLKNLKLIGTKVDGLILPSLSELSPLRSLTLKECGLSELPAAIGRLGLLTELNLDGNALSSLPPEFIHLSYLKRLNLDRNQFKVFPQVLGEMRALKHVSLDGNPFSEEEAARIQRQHHLTIH